MFDHIGLFVTDTARSFPFYEHCLAPLGIIITERQPELGAVIFFEERTRNFLWMGPATGSYYQTLDLKTSGFRPMHLGFAASSPEAVDEFYRLGLAHGGTDNGAPADCGRGIYAAYLLDPDGNNVEAIFRSGAEKFH